MAEITNRLSQLLNNTGELLRHSFTLQNFLQVIEQFGLQVKNNYELTFTGLESIKFFATSVLLPSTTREFGEIYYMGRKIDVPLMYDVDHAVNMTILNDAHGYMYRAFRSLIQFGSTENQNTGETIDIKCFTGDKKFEGAFIRLHSVRAETMSGLSFGNSESDISTFDVTLRCSDIEYIPSVLNEDYNTSVDARGRYVSDTDLGTGQFEVQSTIDKHQNNHL